MKKVKTTKKPKPILITLTNNELYELINQLKEAL